MDFHKKSCKELCEKLVAESIDSVDELREFIRNKCKEYKKKDKKDITLNKETEYLTPVIQALSFKDATLTKSYNIIKFDMTARSNKIEKNDVAKMSKYVEYLEKMCKGLIQLQKAKAVPFSIFRGIGTGKYYKEAAKKINEQTQKCHKTLDIARRKAIKNDLQQNCEELCKKLVNKTIKNSGHLDDFIDRKFTSYKDEIKEALRPIYQAFGTKDSLPDSPQHVKYLEALHSALKKLAELIKIGKGNINLDIGQKKYYKDAIQEISREIARNYDTLQTLKDTEPGIFEGLKNDGNYCYLNTALQELFDIPSFRSKVLASVPPETHEFKELRATKFFFECILGKIKDTGTDFDNKRHEMASFLGYNGNIDSSSDAKRRIEQKCRDQMRILKNKPPLEVPEVANLTPDEKERQKIENQWNEKYGAFFTGDEQLKKVANFTQAISKLYNEQGFKNKVLGIDTNELNLKNSYINLESTAALFNLMDQNGIYSHEVLQIIFHWIEGNDNKAPLYQEIKRSVLKQIGDFERSKKAHILSSDSKVTILQPNRNIYTSLENTFENHRKENMAYYLPLKSNRFSVHLSDRHDATLRPNFSVEETLDLKNLVENGKLKVFIKNKEQEKNKCKFKLISASIGTGGHYYLYKKVGTVWKEFNDARITNHKLTDKIDIVVKRGDEMVSEEVTVKEDIDGRCETLTYELMD